MTKRGGKKKGFPKAARETGAFKRLRELTNRHKPWIILGTSAALLIIDRAFTLTTMVVDSLLLFFIVPMAVILVFFTDSPRDYGLGPGKVKTGLVLAAGGVFLSFLTTYLSVKYSSQIQKHYGQAVVTAPAVIKVFLYMTGWEFMFRGYLLFGLKERWGPWRANIVQTILFTLMHIGKPPLETVSCLVSGPLFGYVSLKSESFWPMVIIHSFIMISAVYFASV